MITKRTVLIAFLAVSLVPFLVTPQAVATTGPTTSDHILVRDDGTEIHFTVHQPENASATATVPLIFHSHGWGGSRGTDAAGFSAYLDAGYGILSFDARGHGDSTGLATVHHVSAEVGDTLALIDWTYDNLDWVTKETASGIDKDILLGGIGGSYGGGFQTTAATHDDRFDALVPQMTWTDLTYALAPDGVVKSVWVDALYGFGLASVDMDPRIHQWFAEAMATNTLPPAASAHFAGSQPDLTSVSAPALFVQGLPDLLFNYIEAHKNYQDVLIAGQESAIVTYLGGHVLPGIQPIGFMGPARGSEPCGAYSDLALAWFDKHLLGDGSAVVPTGVSWALEDGRCVKDVDIDDAANLDNRTVSLGTFAAPSMGGHLLLPIDAGTGILAGTPNLETSRIGLGDRTLFLSLVVRDGATGRIHIIDDQTTPVRTDSLGTGSTGVRMNGIATEIDDDDQLFLRIDSQNEWYATNGGRTPGGMVFVNAKLTVPFLTVTP